MDTISTDGGGTTVSTAPSEFQFQVAVCPAAEHRAPLLQLQLAGKNPNPSQKSPSGSGGRARCAPDLSLCLPARASAPFSLCSSAASPPPPPPAGNAVPHRASAPVLGHPRRHPARLRRRRHPLHRPRRSPARLPPHHPQNYPKLLPADPSGLLLLHADQGRAKGPTVVDRPDRQSFCWLAKVAGYFVLHADADADAAASPSALALPEPELVMNAGHLGILASPTGSGYVVAELQTFLGDDHATLIFFSSDVGEWVDKTVDYPLPARPLCTHGVVALHGRLWWVDLSWCLVACDPCADKPVLAVVPLPTAKELPYGRAAGVIHRYRAVRVSAGRLCFVDMYRNRDSRGSLQVSVWTLPDADSTEWALEHEASFTDIWEHHTYKAAGLPAKIPVLALIHPDDPAVVYFFLEDHLVGVDLLGRAVVACDLYHLVDPPRDLVSSRFVYAWQLPQPLSRSPPDFAKESTEGGPDDVAATLASVNI